MKEQHLYSAGTSQQERTDQQFELDQLAIDATTDADFINFVYQFAGNVAFWNENNHPNGNWQNFFGHDIAFLLATIKLKPLEQYPLFFHELQKRYDATDIESEHEEIQVSLLKKILEISQYLASWCASIQSFDIASPHKTLVQNSVSEVIQSNIWQGYQDLPDCYLGMVYLFSENPNTIAKENLSGKVTRAQAEIEGILNQSPGPSTPESRAAKADEFASYKQVWAYLTKLFESLYRTLHTLKQQAEGFVEQSLKQSDHAPQIALLFSMMEMMRPLTDSLNSFSKKHLDFYYEQVLMQGPKSGQADTVPVHFVLSPSHTQAEHPAGTKLVASESSKTSTTTTAGTAAKSTTGEGVFKTTKPLTITTAKPTAYKTIFNGLIDKELPNSAYERIYAAPEANSSDGFGAKLSQNNPSWPTVGKSYQDASAKEQTKHLATLGWAVSSPLLTAFEGQRTIQVFWQLPDDDLKKLRKELSNLGLPSDDQAIKSFLETAFDIDYTGPKSWVAIKKIEVELSNKALLLPPPGKGGKDQSGSSTPDATDPAPNAEDTKAPLAPKPPQKTAKEKAAPPPSKEIHPPSDDSADKAAQTDTPKPGQQGDQAAAQKKETDADKDGGKPEKTPSEGADKNTKTASGDGSPKPPAKEEATPPVKPSPGLLFRLTIADTMPAVINYDTKIHQGNYATDWPVVRFSLNQNPPAKQQPDSDTKGATPPPAINPYALLRQLRVGPGSIRLDVVGLKTFTFQNDFSLLKPKAPIVPFGVKPVQGNHFYLGNLELFKKPLTALTLKINWFDLPQFPTGFCQYYESYNKIYPDKPYYNSSFQWNSAILLDKAWKPLPFAQVPPPTPKKETPPSTKKPTATPDHSLPKTVQQPAKTVSTDAEQSTPPTPASPDKGKQGTPTPPEPSHSTPAEHKHNWFNSLVDHLKGRVEHLAHHIVPPEPQEKSQPAQSKETSHTTEAPQEAPPKKSTSEPTPHQADSKADPTDMDIAIFQWDAYKEPSSTGDSGEADEHTNKETGHSTEPQSHTPADPKTKKATPPATTHKDPFIKDTHSAIKDISSVLDTVSKAGNTASSKNKLFNTVKSVVLNQASKNITKTAIGKSSPSFTPDEEAAIHAAQKTETSSSGGAPKPTPPPICPHKKEGKLLSSSEFKFDFGKIKWPSFDYNTPSPNPLKWTEHTESGFLRFELRSPAYAFGHEEYPRVVAKVANKNMVTIAHQLDSKAFPPPPIPLGPASGQGGSKTGSSGGSGTGSKPGTGSAHQASSLIPDSVKKKVTDEINHVVTHINPIAGLLLKGAESLHVGKMLEGAVRKLHAHHLAKKKAKEAEEQKKESGKPASTASSTTHPPATTTTSSSGENTKPGSAPAPAPDPSDQLLLPPRPAFTPKIKGIEATYQAQLDFTAAEIGSPQEKIELFHLQPFTTAVAKPQQGEFDLLPQYNDMGYLFIGIEKVKAPEPISLLFVLNESTGNRDTPLPEVEWAYFSNEQWTPFAALSVQDGTKSFTESGIVELNLPATEGSPPYAPLSAKAPPLYWLRASVPHYASAVCETLTIYPHATTAERSTPATSSKPTAGGQHSKTTLQSHQISKLQEAHRSVTKLVQPVASKGGKLPEGQEQMYVRVSEQLRHKGRAVTAWDYEHLILEEFPDIGFARCLNHTFGPSTFAPGHLKVVILPAQLPKTKNKLSPKTAPSIRIGIQEFMKELTDPFAIVEVINPNYEQLKVEAQIRLKPGLDDGHVLQQLNDTMVNIIAAWADKPWTINPFKHSFSYYSLLSAINENTSVEEVLHFALYRIPADPKAPPIELPATFEAIHPSTVWSILTSAPKHKITSARYASLSSAKTPMIQLPAKQKDLPLSKPAAGAEQPTAANTNKAETPPTKTTEPTKESSPPSKVKPKPKRNALFIHSDWYGNKRKS